MNIRDYMIIHKQEGGGWGGQRVRWDTTSFLEHAGKLLRRVRTVIILSGF